MLTIVIIVFASINTPNPAKRDGGATRAVVLSRLAGSGSCFFKLDSELTKRNIMLEGEFMNYSG